MKAKEEYVDAPRETRSKDITVYAIIFLVLLVGAGIFLAVRLLHKPADTALADSKSGIVYDSSAVEGGWDQMTPEEIEKQILKQLRMNGLVNSNLEVIHHLDREIQKESDVIPVAVKDGYVQEAKSSVAGEARFQALRRFVGKRLKRSGQAILKGENGLAPYKDGDRTACDYCPYHAVCGFDTKTAGYGFRRLHSMKPEEVWQEIEEKGGMKEDKNWEGDE